jgi:hypothetical protein
VLIAMLLLFYLFFFILFVCHAHKLITDLIIIPGGKA